MPFSSMPVIDLLSAQMAVQTSRPPPTPMTATSPPRRRWYGADVTSYCTQSSDSRSPSQRVTSVKALPSMMSRAVVAFRSSGWRPGPQ